MSAEAAFVQAILTEPDDHVHRLIYADWLLEHDPAREPLVRRQAVLGPSVRTSLGQKLVPIPAGTFVMGSPHTEEGRDPDETPHEVTLTRSFYLQSTPVTVGQFRAFAEAAGYETHDERGVGIGWDAAGQEWGWGGYSWRSPGWRQKDDEPVVCLAWDDAVAYCRWLGDKDGREYRLPTEAEWEYACRAGTSTPFFFGQRLAADQANYETRRPYPGGRGPAAVGRTTPVGRYPANAWGLFDMHGNVWEWCNDWYAMESYGRAARRDPRGPRGGTGRVLRGGSWYNPARDCRSALRRNGNRLFSRYNDSNTGFRLALSGAPAARRRGKKG